MKIDFLIACIQIAGSLECLWFVRMQWCLHPCMIHLQSGRIEMKPTLEREFLEKAYSPKSPQRGIPYVEYRFKKRKKGRNFVASSWATSCHARNLQKKRPRPHLKMASFEPGGCNVFHHCIKTPTNFLKLLEKNIYFRLTHASFYDTASKVMETMPLHGRGKQYFIFPPLALFPPFNFSARWKNGGPQNLGATHLVRFFSFCHNAFEMGMRNNWRQKHPFPWVY